ncbi:MAG: helix-turn-helix domain-containing protein [Haloarculaceae archaeon]
MSSLFPLRRSVELDDSREPKLVDMDEDVADEVFEALSSGTTRRIFGHLHDEPHTASDLADLTETSVQNVQYHLGKLENADLVEVVDTWYSERGTEMKVYAPRDESLVVFAGGEERGRLRELLKRAVAILAVLGPVAAMLGWMAGRLADGGRRVTEDVAPRVAGGDGGDGGDSGAVEATAEAAGDAGSQAASYATEAGQAAGGIDPALLAGAAFFLGGVFALTLVFATWYWRE